MPKTVQDMIGRTITVPSPPQRIISLVPSQTELLYDLGLDAQVAGITKFCVHPESWYRGKKRIGGTKNINMDVIDMLAPDLIIANKEENTKEQVEALSLRYPTWVSDIHSIADALTMIHEVGSIIGREQQAAALIAEIRQGFDRLKKAAEPRKAAYFIWRKPWMCAGGDTFIGNMLQTIGWQNVFSDIPRYPEVDADLLKSRDPDLLLLSSEPYPFKDAHMAELQAILPHAEIRLADGELFSWYGSRMKIAAHEFMKWVP